MSTNSIMTGLLMGSVASTNESIGFNNGYRAAQVDINNSYHKGYTEGWNQAKIESAQVIFSAVNEANQKIEKANSVIKNKNDRIAYLTFLLSQHGVHV